MKKILLNVALASASLVFAQKKEIQNAVKATKDGNYSEALSQISNADNSLQGKFYFLEPSLQEQYYYAKGLALLKSGKTSQGATVLSKISDLKKNKIFTGKDNTKKKVYFVGKAEADKYGSGLQLREESYSPSLVENIGATINPMLNEVSTEAQKEYDAKNYASAAEKFLQVNDLLSAAGQPDNTYKYYAGISYALANKKAEAIALYKDLIDSGYTGVKNIYSAVNKKTNQRENLDKNSFELLKKTSDYTDFKTETTKNVEEELYETAIALMLDDNKNEEAVDLIEKGLVKFPDNKKLNDFKLSAYSRTGDTTKLEQTIKEAIAKNPKDKLNWSNLGVIQSNQPSSLTQAEDSFKKALDIDPSYVPALQGLVFNLYLNSKADASIVDAYNAARKAGKIEEANKIIAERKMRFTKALPYLEKLHSLTPEDADVVETLRTIYSSLGKYDKAKALKTLKK
ncbi:tetratricopeptide repeat protein [Elizabethkingia argentiflava]|uniref:Tetratricopeptide repeat protein n=1 Tax=Elizabethkingia argenteiflava TaxID=2681556 RepID=A0A845PXI7_9FLAO|nr:tetratricopeptide repeat protein [Elizabethkingia argenteiflava]NAW50800.1 tetratricopeptide repeat protein [Elizabethkingia argenteiflava]